MRGTITYMFDCWADSVVQTNKSLGELCKTNLVIQTSWTQFFKK